MKRAAATKDGPAPKRGAIEKAWLEQGLRFAGVDEVGRGCIAGPVFAACVVLNFGQVMGLKKRDRDMIRDSKTLSSLQRAKLVPVIQSLSHGWAVGAASVGEIEQLGIVQATFLSMRRAIAGCGQEFDWLLVDGTLRLTDYDGAQQTVIKGDSLCLSIAAASILAKEARDAHMRTMDVTFPGYGFGEHVGYATRAHLDSITRNGICAMHRRNFEPIRSHVVGATAVSASS